MISLSGYPNYYYYCFFFLAGPNSFYVTNDKYFHFDSTFLNFLYLFILHNWLYTNIVFHDGSKAIVAIGGVHPNGITMDKDERLEFLCYVVITQIESNSILAQLDVVCSSVLPLS